MTSERSAVKIKGIRDGLLVTLSEGNYADVLHLLSQELAQKQAFLRGSRVALQVGPRPLTNKQLDEIQALCARHGMALWAVLTDDEGTRQAARHFGLATRLPGSQTDLDGRAITVTPAAEGEKAGSAISGETAPGGLLLKETVRSGRSVYHEGHVVVIGDVNPGAEVIAGGDVVVWGRLRGLVHAGAMGDRTAVICALELNPTQLRIADQIAISPDERQRRPMPEQASIRAGQIVAEPWPVRG